MSRVLQIRGFLLTFFYSVLAFVLAVVAVVVVVVVVVV